MEVRPATMDDLPLILELQRRFDLAWFGKVEQSAEEVREFLGYAEPLADGSLLLLDAGRLIALGMRFGADSVLTVDPEAAVTRVLAHMLTWFAERPGTVAVIGRDEAIVAGLEASGWTYHKSAYDLIADVIPDLTLAEPRWPEGVTVRDLDVADAAAVHRLIYVDAGWAEVPGHPDRDFENWRQIFITEHTVPAQQVIAWRGERIVGVALGRTWDDGTGWVSQLATAKDERGRGLGRAMLLEAMRRRVAAGATSLGLSVQAANRAALSLYLDVGLRVEREFRTYGAPTR
jgi:ribosomal protein S18 acetylase RimI-like enzyme